MKITGITVGTTLPKSNFDQTDPSKGDYIKGDRSFLNIDSTLTTEGSPADAKATGDAISKVKSDIVKVSDTKPTDSDTKIWINTSEEDEDSPSAVTLHNSDANSHADIREEIDAMTPLVVTITENEDGTYTSSHGVKTIVDASVAGKTVVAKLGNVVYSLAMTMGNALPTLRKAVFSRVEGSVERRIVITASKVTVETYDFALKSDLPDVSNVSMQPFYLIIGEILNDDMTEYQVSGGVEGSIENLGVATFYEGAEAALVAMDTAYKSGKAVFAHFTVGENSGMSLPLLYSDGETSIFGVFIDGMSVGLSVVGDMAVMSFQELVTVDNLPTTDEINALIDAKLGVIENGTY